MLPHTTVKLSHGQQVVTLSFVRSQIQSLRANGQDEFWTLVYIKSCSRVVSVSQETQQDILISKLDQCAGQGSGDFLKEVDLSIVTTTCIMATPHKKYIDMSIEVPLWDGLFLAKVLVKLLLTFLQSSELLPQVLNLHIQVLHLHSRTTLQSPHSTPPPAKQNITISTIRSSTYTMDKLYNLHIPVLHVAQLNITISTFQSSICTTEHYYLHTESVMCTRDLVETVTRDPPLTGASSLTCSVCRSPPTTVQCATGAPQSPSGSFSSSPRSPPPAQPHSQASSSCPPSITRSRQW